MFCFVFVCAFFVIYEFLVSKITRKRISRRTTTAWTGEPTWSLPLTSQNLGSKVDTRQEKDRAGTPNHQERLAFGLRTHQAFMKKKNKNINYKNKYRQIGVPADDTHCDLFPPQKHTEKSMGNEDKAWYDWINSKRNQVSISRYPQERITAISSDGWVKMFWHGECVRRCVGLTNSNNCFLWRVMPCKTQNFPDFVRHRIILLN